MISLDSVYIAENQLDFQGSLDHPDLQISIGGSSHTINPPVSIFSFKLARVPFGKACVNYICESSETSYKDEYINSILGFEQYEKMLEIKWVRYDAIFIKSDKMKFVNGFIANNFDEPITYIETSGFGSAIGFLYGEIIPIYTLEGQSEQVELQNHWWDYINSLMTKKIFKNEETYKELFKFALGTSERNVFEKRG